MIVEWRQKIERIGGLVIKEFRQVMRDPRMARVIFIAPIIQLMVFGYAVSTDIWKTAMFVVDHDSTIISRALITGMTASGYFEVVGYSDRPADLVQALDHGEAILGIEIPKGFAGRLQSGTGATVQILLDGTNSNTAMVAQSYAARIVQDYAARLSEREIPMLIDLRERAWFNGDLSSRNYNVPAVVGSLILLISLLLTSLSVVREREIGTLEQLRVSPLTPGELIAGKTIPFAIIGLVDLIIVTIIAIWWFEIPFRGNPFLLIGASILYLFSSLGLGLLISTISSTQQEAFMASFLVFMPALLLSGFMFPVSSMPEIFQWFTYINPLRHYIEIVRSLYLKGSGLDMLMTQFVALACIGIALLGFATIRFRRTSG